MAAKPAKRKSADEPPLLTLPPGLTEEEEATWWDDHPEYWEGLPYEVMPPMQIRPTQAVPLWLPIETVEALKAEAARRGMVYQTMIRTWLEDRLRAEAAELAGEPNANPPEG